MKKGDKVTYTGKGFLGFNKNSSEMTYIEEDKKSLFGVWVKYKGHRMLVNSHEITTTV